MPPIPPMAPPPGKADPPFCGCSAYHHLCGHKQSGYRRRALQGQAHDLGRIDDAGLEHVDIGIALPGYSTVFFKELRGREPQKTALRASDSVSTYQKKLLRRIEEQ